MAGVRTLLRSAAYSLQDASTAFGRSVRTIETTAVIGSPGYGATLFGSLEDLGTFTRLVTSREVNEQTSTVRASTGPIGLDVASPERSSVLDSSPLGLDVTSPEAVSILESNALGLDLVTPESASSLASSAALGLDVTSPESVSTLTSTAEANTAPTSYSAVQLTFRKTSGAAQTSLGTLSGVYAGTGVAANATQLRLRVTSPDGQVGSTVPSLVTIRVFDQNNTSLGTFSGLVTAGQKISLGSDIGLDIAFSEGTILNSAETTLSVDRNTPTDVDPNAVFNDADVNLRPRFDGGAQIAAGSFTVNGATVQVYADDTINSVLARIASTVPGISATFSGDKATLATTTSSEDDIVLGNDTSGFLAALKLTGASTVRGNVRDDRQVLSKTSQFGSVQSGSFTVNGVAILVDRNSDTLESVIDRINTAGAGVTATYDATTDRLRLTTTANTEDLIVLEDDTTGFLEAARLDTANTIRGNIRDDQQVLSKTSQFSSVLSGSFTVNGVAIAVDAASDTLLSVIARINESGAGVIAAYDTASDRIRLTSTENTEDLIAVENDTTGFLAAAGLSSANTVRGNVRDDAQVLAKTTQFASVQSGSFRVNGVTISVDAATDSISSLVSRINEAGAGVLATYDAESDRLRLTTTEKSEEEIALGDDTTGFLAAAGLAGANTVRGNVRDDLQALSKTAPFASVQSGSFSVNGTRIDVDAGSDSLQSVIDRINAAGAGVVASYDGESDAIVFTPQVAGSRLVIENDTSGLLAATGVATGASGTAVDPDARLDGMGARSPFFEDGVRVVAGSFRVNGVRISVEDSDTLRGVLEKITASSAGVTATFDSESEKIRLTARAAGDHPILLTDDTSGFLDAVKLDETAILTSGRSTMSTPLAEHAVFGSVGQGTITANGRSIGVDPDRDTLQGIADALNGIDGVIATLDPGSGRIVVKARQVGAALEIEDTSGLLSVIGIATGRTEGSPSTLRTVRTATGGATLDDPKTADKVAAAALEIAGAARQALGVWDASPLYRSEVASALRAAVGSLRDAQEKGVSLVEENGQVELRIDMDRLARALRQDPAALDPFLNGSDGLSHALGRIADAYDGAAVGPPPEEEPAPPGAQPGEKTKLDLSRSARDQLLTILGRPAASLLEPIGEGALKANGLRLPADREADRGAGLSLLRRDATAIARSAGMVGRAGSLTDFVA